MVRRIVIVFMLLLLPLQWTAAQFHESSSPAASVAKGSAFVQNKTADEAGSFHFSEDRGIPCPFHNVAQPSAVGDLPNPWCPTQQASNAWVVPRHLRHQGKGAANDIERPKWPFLAPSTVDGGRTIA
ncbi:hypothetical protein QRO11_11160 [Paracidovorax citrulli]|uniref:Uncharacterized protein n=1 Tax=Paracidovorax citrulli TaxID=80869 RepID=A0ABY9AVL1_PARCI|nr:hypothetical protein [Paracidovorax citrulli]ATG92969.1 hypothetical protein CQB05_02015 [Paracidovorax citrulli]MVT29025.1 hypothetical protein [Paracidovorax citrulli]MVT36704.1 hypothetical protein [Paracidovorax citrulli]PVY67308.1 hypothetical protein C8E08_4748 [Paracidovorax citrulli]QCX09051.1 hypothetical protein APS58_0065 [Paracidovorax citrulli]